MKSVVLNVGILLLFCHFSNAQVPGTLSYQGILVDASGSPVGDGIHQVTFNFYDGSKTFKFSRGPVNVTTYKGMFSFLIGTGFAEDGSTAIAENDALPVDATDPNYIGGGQYYVGLVVDSSPELSPRVMLSSVPYAFQAQNAKAVISGSIGGNTSINTTGDITTSGSGSVVVSGATTLQGTLAVGDPAVTGSAGEVLISQGSSPPIWAPVSLNNVLIGNSTVFIGELAGQLNDTGYENTFVGNQSGSANTTGFYNTFIGFNAGNANTIASGNTFVGRYAGSSSTTGGSNTFLGVGAGASNLTGQGNLFVGYDAGLSNTSAQSNVFVGNSAGNSTTIGGSNLAVGTRSLYSNVGGLQATAVGAGAMEFANNTATSFVNSNVAVGFEAMRGSSDPGSNTGNQNTAIGFQSLLSNSSGSGNTATGYQVLAANTTGIQNSGFGYESLVSNTTGSFNTAYGWHGLYTNATGSNNTALGYNADVSTSGLTNATVIGYNAKVTTSNSMALGGTGTDAVHVGIGTTTPLAGLHVVSNGIDARKGDILAETSIASGQSSLQFNRSQGTPTAPSHVLAGDNLGRVNFAGYSGSEYTTSAMINSTATTDFTGAGNVNANLEFYTALNGATTERMRISADGNVGIGTTTAPVEKLEVVGNIVIPETNDYSYSNPKSKNLVIGHSAFQLAGINTSVFASRPVTSSNPYILRTTGGTAGVAAYFIAPVNLPDGATITEMNAYVFDNDGTNDLSVRLVRQLLGVATFNTISTVTSSGAPVNTVYNSTSITNPVVDNNFYSYQLVFQTTEANANMGLYHVKITYAVTKAD